MRKTENILSIIGIAFLLLNILFIFPGVNSLLILIFTILSLIYSFLGFALFNEIQFRKLFKKESYNNVSSLRILVAVAAGISLSITIIGILFKIMFWPGYYINMLFGIVCLTLIIIVILVNKFNRQSEFGNKILNRSIVFGGIAICLTFISNQKIAAIKYRNDPKYAKAMIDVMDNPNNEEYQLKLEEEQRRRELYDNGE